jgi:hypothetical protein
MEITLNVLWNRSEDQILLDAGLDVDVDLDDCPMVEHTFYNIDFIRSHTANRDYSVICISNEEYLTKIDYKDLKTLITAQRNLLTFFN